MDPVPILVLASGQRCGSTLVQRLLSSHPRVMIWGEHGGHLRKVLDAGRDVAELDDILGWQHRELYSEGGHDSWMANLLPGPQYAAAATRSWMEALFAEPARERGRPLWGLKEVRLGLDVAEGVRAAFPGCRVIHLTRDPRHVLASLDFWEATFGWWTREHTREVVRAWVDINESFAGSRDGVDWITSWRYEDVTHEPDRFLGAVAELVQQDPGEFDRGVFDRRVDSRSGPPAKRRPFAELDPELRGLLDDERVRAVAHDYGYELESGAGGAWPARVTRRLRRGGPGLKDA